MFSPALVGSEFKLLQKLSKAFINVSGKEGNIGGSNIPLYAINHKS